MAITVTPPTNPSAPVAPATPTTTSSQLYTVYAVVGAGNPAQYALGDTLERTVVYSGTTVVSTKWTNATKGTTLTVTPPAGDISVAQVSPLTNSELRASPVKVQDDVLAGVLPPARGPQTDAQSLSVYVTNQPSDTMRILATNYLAIADDAVNGEYVTGQYIQRIQVYDIGQTPVGVTSDTWTNLATDLVLTTPPDFSTIEYSSSGDQALTDTQLRASAIHVIVDNQSAPVTPATTYQTYADSYTAIVDDALHTPKEYVTGDRLRNVVTVDSSNSSVVSNVWENVTQGTIINPPAAASITAVPASALTDAELRATPIEVYVTNPTQTSDATQNQFVVETFQVIANGTGYSTGDIVRRESIVDTSVSPATSTETWTNVTTGVVIAAPLAGHIAATQTGVGLTDAELRASAIHVIVDNQVTVPGPAPTENVVMIEVYAAIADAAEYAAGDILRREVYADTTVNPYNVLSEEWYNLTQGALLTGVPVANTIAAMPNNSLTDSELRAAALHVIVDNQVTIPPAATITTKKTVFESYIAQANDTKTPSEYSIGDVIDRVMVLDTANTPASIESDVWSNKTTGGPLTVAPSGADVSQVPSQPLTNNELRAAPVEVFVTNQVTISPSGPATQLETIVTTYSAKQDPTLPLSYTKGDILQLTEVIDNSSTPPSTKSSVWKNVTTSTENIAVDRADITILPSSSLTNAELRALPVNVYNSDYEFETYVANANGTGYVKGDIIRRETKVVFGSTDTVTETWTNVTQETTLASVDTTHLSLTPEVKQGYSTETLNYVATQDDATNSEYAVDDELQRTVQWDNTAVPPVSIGEKWFNVSTGAFLTTPPLQTHYRIYSGVDASIENSVTNMYVMNAGVIPPGAFQLSIANLGNADGYVQGSKLPPGISVDFTADAGDYLSQVTYDASGTEFLITIVQSAPTGAVTPVVNAPIVTSPSSGAQNQEPSLTLTSSPFSGFGPVGSHLSTDWEVYTDASLTTLTASVYDSVANLTSFAVSGLTNGEDYFIRVRHKSTTGLVSGWSNLSSFTVKNPASVNPPVWTMTSFILDVNDYDSPLRALADTAKHKIEWTRDEFSGMNNPGSAKDLVFQFATDAAFTNVVKTLTYTDDAATLSYVEPRAQFGQVLPPADVTYKVRAKRVSTTGVESPWSAAQDVYIVPTPYVGYVSTRAGSRLKMTIGEAIPGAKLHIWGNNTTYAVSTGQTIDIVIGNLGNGIFSLTGVRHAKHVGASGGLFGSEMQLVQWGETQWTSFANMFNNLPYASNPSNIYYSDPWYNSGNWYFGNQTLDVPVLSKCTSMERAFYTSGTPANLRLAQWDVSNVTNMKEAFAWCSMRDGGVGLNNWNVSSVTTMEGLFEKAQMSTGISLANWNVSNVTNMSRAFKEPLFWQQTDFNAFEFWFTNWNVSNVTDMSYMFYGHRGGGTPWMMSTLANWDVSNVTDMSYMFYGKSPTFSFSNWDTSKVANFEGMFMYAWNNYTVGSLAPISGAENLVTSACTNMRRMFYTAQASININMSAWDTSNVTNMSELFSQAELSSIARNSLGTWNTSNVTTMEDIFYYNRSTGPVNIGSWDVSKVTTFKGAFYAPSFVTAMTADLSNWNTSSAIIMESMFEAWGDSNNSSEGFNPGNIANWDVSNVSNMVRMFDNNERFNADLSGWCVQNIPSKPANFDNGTTAWTLPKPVWGTCP